MKFVLQILLFLLLPLFLCGAEIEKWSVPVETDLYLQKQGFSLGYSHKYRQAIWVAYILTADNLKAKQVARSNAFKPDLEVKYRPVYPREYTRTGYDKGHLAPAADMTYSVPSMESSFLMTNISPQIPGCNRGIWKRLESQVRRWALKEGKLFVVTGPIFSDNFSVMGKSSIPIPMAFYKVVLDLTPPMKMIGFIVPNETSKRHVASFVVPVDNVEIVTGCNFFSELDDELEKRLEAASDYTAWEK